MLLHLTPIFSFLSIMNTTSVNDISLHTKRLTAFVLVLVLWTGFAFVEHQLDINEQHHAHHHCQLFSGAFYGIPSSFPVLPLIIQETIIQKRNATASIFKTLPVKKARAPPESSICSSIINHH